MEHWDSTLGAFPDTCMEVDFNDEVFFQGYWMENNDGFSLVEPDCEFQPIFRNSYHEICQAEMEKSPEELPLDCMGIDITTSLLQSHSPFEGGKFGGKWWFGSMEVKESSPTTMMEAENNSEFAYVSRGYSKEEEPEEEFKVVFEKVSQPDPCTMRRRLMDVRKPGQKKQTKPEKTISLQVLRRHFACSLKDAAKSMGVCPTTLKRICRQYGIMRWPSRKIKKVSHSLKKLQLVVDSVEGAEGLIKINTLHKTIPELDLSKHSPFSSSSHKLNDNSKKPKSQRSDSSSSSQTSGSSFSHSFEAKEFTKVNGLNLDRSSDSEQAIVVPQNSDKESIPPRISEDGSSLKVKATFGECKIRFSLQPHWNFKNLQLEIAKRFGIDDCNGIHLEYLDNDFESVLLTCDEDLQECKDLFRFSHGHTIKMSLHKLPQLGVACS